MHARLACLNVRLHAHALDACSTQMHFTHMYTCVNMCMRWRLKLLTTGAHHHTHVYVLNDARNNHSNQGRVLCPLSKNFLPGVTAHTTRLRLTRERHMRQVAVHTKNSAPNFQLCPFSPSTSSVHARLKQVSFKSKCVHSPPPLVDKQSNALTKNSSLPASLQESGALRLRSIRQCKKTRQPFQGPHRKHIYPHRLHRMQTTSQCRRGKTCKRYAMQAIRHAGGDS